MQIEGEPLYCPFPLHLSCTLLTIKLRIGKELVRVDPAINNLIICILLLHGSSSICLGNEFPLLLLASLGCDLASSNEKVLCRNQT